MEDPALKLFKIFILIAILTLPLSARDFLPENDMECYFLNVLEFEEYMSDVVPDTLTFAAWDTVTLIMDWMQPCQTQVKEKQKEPEIPGNANSIKVIRIPNSQVDYIEGSVASTIVTMPLEEGLYGFQLAAKLSEINTPSNYCDPKVVYIKMVEPTEVPMVPVYFRIRFVQ
jgi:hypothetical protein